MDISSGGIFLFVAAGCVVGLVNVRTSIRRGNANGNRPVQPYANAEELAAAESRLKEISFRSPEARRIVMRIRETDRPGFQRGQEVGMIVMFVIGIVLFAGLALAASLYS